MGNRNRAVNNLGSGWIKNTPKYCFPCYFSLTNSMRKENFMDAIIILVPLYLSKKYEKKTFYCIKIKLMLFLILLTSILRRFVKIYSYIAANIILGTHKGDHFSKNSRGNNIIFILTQYIILMNVITLFSFL